MNGRRVRGANVPSPTPVARHRDAAIRPATSSPETHPMKVMTVFGTRPEAIKMFPVVHALRERCGVDVRVCVTAQHREMLEQVLHIARIVPDVDLDVMQAHQKLDALPGGLGRKSAV